MRSASSFAVLAAEDRECGVRNVGEGRVQRGERGAMRSVFSTRIEGGMSAEALAKAEGRIGRVIGVPSYALPASEGRPSKSVRGYSGRLQ